MYRIMLIAMVYLLHSSLTLNLMLPVQIQYILKHLHFTWSCMIKTGTICHQILSNTYRRSMLMNASIHMQMCQLATYWSVDYLFSWAFQPGYGRQLYVYEYVNFIVTFIGSLDVTKIMYVLWIIYKQKFYYFLV